MKVLVTGVNGQLGFDVVRELVSRGCEAVGSGSRPAPEGNTRDYVQMDICDRDAVRQTVSALRPDAVVHCAAWTNVDGAEAPENVEKVFAVNAGGTENIALACSEIGAGMIYISTDYVFDGRGEEPWKPDDTRYAPLGIYGKSKLEGELAVRRILDRFFIVRTAWVFGENGKNFVRTMLRVAQNHDRVRVVNDQIGTPTYTPDLARLLADMLQTERYGVYHATNEGGFISWADFTEEIFRQAGLATEVIPVSTEEYGGNVAARPKNSRLDKSKLAENGFRPLPDWKDALGRYLRVLTA